MKGHAESCSLTLEMIKKRDNKDMKAYIDGTSRKLKCTNS